MFAAETSYNLFTAWCTVTKVLSNFSFRLFLKLPLVGRLIFEDIVTDDIEWGSLFVSLCITYICQCIHIGTNHNCFFSPLCYFFVQYYIITGNILKLPENNQNCFSFTTFYWFLEWKERKGIKKTIKELWNFPNSCGTTNGKPVRLGHPARSGSVTREYTALFSLQ